MTGRDYSYPKHILEAIEYIEDFSKKFNSADDLKNCPLERAAIERMLTIHRGSCKEYLTTNQGGISGFTLEREITGMRDKIMHHYFGVDYEAVFETVKHDIPDLKEKILEILSVRE